MQIFLTTSEVIQMWKKLYKKKYFFLIVSQTLTGKEIEIDIEPTDKVWVLMSLKCE